MNKKKIYKVIILGGGASGLFSAAKLASSVQPSSILLLEKMDRVGKKLSASGNGQGNVGNRNLDKRFYHGDTNFALQVIERYGVESLIEFFYQLGVPLINDGRDRLYPPSMQASSLTDCLRFFLGSKGIHLKVNSEIIKAEKDDFFKVYTNDEVFYGESLIIAMGGCVSPHFGTDGSGYKIAEQFKHKVTALSPSLVQIKTETEKIKGLKGIKADCAARVYLGGKMIREEFGEVLFTDYGVSGNAIFALSGAAAESENATITLEFLPDYSSSQLFSLLKDKIENNAYLPLSELFTGIINKQLGRAVLKVCRLTDYQQSIAVAEEKLGEIVDTVKNFELRVTGSTGFKNAQVTRGGVETYDIDAKSMMSGIVNNLYFCGEVLNVDGDCGGYNLQFAYSSAMVAATDIISKIK